MTVHNRTTILALLSVLVFASHDAASAEKSKKVYYMNSGGTTQTMYVKDGWAKRFEEETGYELVIVLKGNSEQVMGTAVAQKKNPQVDIIEAGYASWLKGYYQGVFAKLDPKKLPNLSQLYDIGHIKKDGGLYGLSTFAYVLGFIYNKDVFAKKGWEPPRVWADLFDPRYKGKLLIPGPKSTYGMYTLIEFAKMNGGDERNMDPGFAAMARLAPGIAEYVTSGSKTAQLMYNGTGDLAVYSISQTRSFQRAGVPAAFTVPPRAYVNLNVLSATANGPNPEGALAFLNFAASEPVLTYRATEFGQTPFNKNVKIKKGQKGAEALFDVEAISTLINIDYEYAVKHRSEWIRRFQAEIAPIPRAK